ncbi:hypothetical protein MKW98_023818 [Papaver atlanticum]|uniref:Purple acid phosphatase n=1 Tax=Papaver atlanticum TaxID=357466 RepID=A0AAD4SZH5_9MAGN|nr:hypothetical protein MKW98_023818 [Papaver atlanticum]
MTAIGNHERDYINSGSVYITPDSGGECGVAYEAYFPMPTSAKDKPWYSINQAGIHFTVISTKHPWTENSEQVFSCGTDAYPLLRGLYTNTIGIDMLSNGS